VKIHRPAPRLQEWQNCEIKHRKNRNPLNQIGKSGKRIKKKENPGLTSVAKSDYGLHRNWNIYTSKNIYIKLVYSLIPGLDLPFILGGSSFVVIVLLCKLFWSVLCVVVAMNSLLSKAIERPQLPHPTPPFRAPTYPPTTTHHPLSIPHKHTRTHKYKRTRRTRRTFV